MVCFIADVLLHTTSHYIVHATTTTDFFVVETITRITLQVHDITDQRVSLR